MIRTVAGREILDNLMSLKFLFGTVVCLVLVVISTVVSLRDYQNRVSEYDSAIAEFNEKPDTYEPRIYRKPEVLSIFVRGFEKRFGNVVTILWQGDIPVQAGGFMGTSESAQFSAEFASIDFLFVVRVIISLLAIFLSYDAVSGEYERGTLKLTLSRPVPRSSVILGKLLAGAGCLLIPLLMSFIIGILIVRLMGGIVFTSGEWLRISLIAGSAILCVMSFFMMGLAVSSRTRHAATSLLILLLIWIVGVFLVPGVTTAAMDRYRLMTPNPGKEIAAIEKDIKKREEPIPPYEPGDEDDLAAWNELYAKYRLKWDKLMDEKAQSIWSVQNQYLNRLNSQADLVRWICRLSPSESCSYAAEAMAGTDVMAYTDFMNYVRSFYNQHRKFVQNQFRDKEKYDTEKEQYSKAVEPPHIDFAASFRSAAPDICLLVIFNVLFFMLSILFFIRYDVH